MFVYSVRASTIKFFAVILLTVSALVILLSLGGLGRASVLASSDNVNFGGVKTNEDRVEFIAQFGIEVEEVPIEESDFSIPRDFDRILSEYNEIQKRQGLDISKYKNKKVTRYTYTVKNYDGYDGAVCVNLLVHRNTVIACDVSSQDPTGFVEPLLKFE